MLKNAVVFLCLAAAVAAQTKPAPAKPAVKHEASATPASPNTGMPSEEAVDGFMKQMVGYNPGVTWKVAEIRPAAVPGLTEVVVVITDPQGSNTNKFYVTSDGKHAVTGDIIPFGPKPFEQDREEPVSSEQTLLFHGSHLAEFSHPGENFRAVRNDFSGKVQPKAARKNCFQNALGLG